MKVICKGHKTCNRHCYHSVLHDRIDYCEGDLIDKCQCVPISKIKLERLLNVMLNVLILGR